MIHEESASIGIILGVAFVVGAKIRNSYLEFVDHELESAARQQTRLAHHHARVPNALALNDNVQLIRNNTKSGKNEK